MLRLLLISILDAGETVIPLRLMENQPAQYHGVLATMAVVDPMLVHVTPAAHRKKTNVLHRREPIDLIASAIVMSTVVSVEIRLLNIDHFGIT